MPVDSETSVAFQAYRACPEQSLPRWTLYGELISISRPFLYTSGDPQTTASPSIVNEMAWS